MVSTVPTSSISGHGPVLAEQEVLPLLAPLSRMLAHPSFTPSGALRRGRHAAVELASQTSEGQQVLERWLTVWTDCQVHGNVLAQDRIVIGAKHSGHRLRNDPRAPRADYEPASH